MAITWETIRTYFTDYDRKHMLQIQPQLDLWDYASVKDNAVLIYPRLANKTMPPGGWTGDKEVWIANFKAWIDAGYPES